MVLRAQDKGLCSQHDALAMSVTLPTYPSPLAGSRASKWKLIPGGITFCPTPGWGEQDYLFLSIKPLQWLSDAVVTAGMGWAAASVTASACSCALHAGCGWPCC